MSPTRLRIAAAMVATTSMFGCSESNDGGPPPQQQPGPPSLTRVTKEVITAKACASLPCHDNPQNGFVLTSKAALHTDLVDQAAGGPSCGPNSGPDGGPSPTYIRVIPGDPENSLLYQKLAGSPPCGDPMPPLTDPLGSEQVKLVYDWIALGAKND
jgi:hypothetical protein